MFVANGLNIIFKVISRFSINEDAGIVIACNELNNVFQEICFSRTRRTINTRLSAISSLFRHLIESQKATLNPALDVKRMKGEYDQVKLICLTPQEARKMMDAPIGDSLQSLRDRAMLKTTATLSRYKIR